MNTAITKKPLRQVETVKQLLINEQAQSQLAAVAAKHMKPERMMRLMANAIRTTPKLAQCEPITLLGAMMTSASLGLEPNTPLGHAYLIPFENRRKGVTEVTFIIGYKGMISLARRSGQVVNIHADVVYDGDEFSYEYGSDQHLRHKPKGPRQNPTHAYCHAKLVDGEAFVVLPWEVIEDTRDNSQGYKTAIRFKRTDTPWIANLHAMAKKTAVRRLFDELPISIEEANDGVAIEEGNPDFSAFAFDPESGIHDAEGDVIEGEAQETDQQPDPKVDAEDAIEEDKSKSKDSKSKIKETSKKADPVNADHQRLFDDIVNNLADGMPADMIGELYSEDALDRMKIEEPKLYGQLTEEIEAHAKSSDTSEAA